MTLILKQEVQGQDIPGIGTTNPIVEIALWLVYVQ